jgi:hypothetical protein
MWPGQHKQDLPVSMYDNGHELVAVAPMPGLTSGEIEAQAPEHGAVGRVSLTREGPVALQGGDGHLALAARGQSVSQDNITRASSPSGRLKRLVEEDGLRGVTSNPTVF